MLRAWAIALALVGLAGVLLFGAVDRGVWAALAVAAGVTMVAASLQQWRAGAPAVHPRYLAPVLVPAVLALAAAGLQLWPEPGGGLAHPLWATVRGLLAVPVTDRITLTPDDTLDEIVRLATYLALFWTAVQVGRSPRCALGVLRWTVAGVGAFAAYGLAVELGGLEKVLWMAKTAYVGDLTGTLVNRNTAAAVIGLGWIAATLLFLGELGGRLQGVEGTAERRRRAGAYLLGPGLGLAGVWVVLVTALLLTHSRAGLATAVAGLAVGVVLVVQRSFASRGRRLTLGLLSAGLVLVVAFSGGAVLDRLHGTDVGEERRWEAYAVTLNATRDSPWLGTGLGSFREVFRIYQPADLPGNWGKAHSTYLEHALEGGYVWALLVIAAAAAAIAICFAGAWRRRRDVHLPAIGAAVGVQMGLHSLVDFTLQIPGPAALTAVLLGVCVAQSWSTRIDLRRP